MKQYDYKRNIGFNHDEAPARINLKDGTVTQVKVQTFPEGQRLHRGTKYSKVEDAAIAYLEKELTNVELAVVFKMIRCTEYATNSMKPLNNESTVRELSDQFGIGINSVAKVFKKLFDYGVYAQFKVAKEDAKEFWIMNPYLCFKGRFIKDSLWENFKGTKIERAVREYS